MTEKPVTHDDLMPRGLCPAMRMKQMLTHTMHEQLSTPRKWPGDGYYWCTKTCQPVGPDDELVNPGACLPGRRCYDGPQA